jgi:hypothetical protein
MITNHYLTCKELNKLQQALEPSWVGPTQEAQGALRKTLIR